MDLFTPLQISSDAPSFFLVTHIFFQFNIISVLVEYQCSIAGQAQCLYFWFTLPYFNYSLALTKLYFDSRFLIGCLINFIKCTTGIEENETCNENCYSRGGPSVSGGIPSLLKYIGLAMTSRTFSWVAFNAPTAFSWVTFSRFSSFT